MNVRADTAGDYNWIVVAASLVAAVISLILYWQLQFPIASAVTVALVFLAVAVARPSAALALLCAVLPVEGIAAANIEMTEVRAVGIGVFVIWVVHLVLYRKLIRVNRTFLLGAALVAWAGVSLLWATNFEITGAYYFTLIQVLLLALLCINVIENETDFRLVLGGLLLGALITSHLSLAVFVENVVERARTFEAQNPNSYAMVVGFSMLGGMYLMRSMRRWWIKVGLLLATLFMAVPLILAQSRTAWMATVAGFAVMIWHTRHRVRNFLILFVITAGLLAGLFAAGLVNITLVERTSQLMTMREKGTSRFDVWMVASNMIADNPVLGVGYMQFPSRFNQYRPATPSIRRDLHSRRDPHSTYFSVIAELGIVGFALLMAMLWSACREEKIHPGGKPWLSDSFVVYLMMFSVGGTLLHAKLFWVGLALAAKARHLAAVREENLE
ncbi:MAG: O-antigen ligase family protein [Candidatus Glassbacteria bacterium]|nr:O-antigen ligase family protein [Candidatus Glassbacteria bacterium]